MSRLTPLNQRLNRLLFWVAGAAFVIAVMAMTFHTQTRETSEYLRGMSGQLHIASSLISDFIRADATYIGRYVADRKPSEYPQILRQLQSSFAIQGLDDLVYVLDDSGRVIATADGYDNFLGLNFSHLDAVSLGFPVSGVHQSLLSKRSVVSLSFPMADGMTLVLERDLVGIVPLMDHVAQGTMLSEGLLFILSADGTAVYHPDAALVKTRHNLGMEIERTSTADISGLHLLRYRGESYLALTQALTIPTGWHLYYAVPVRILETAIVQSAAIPAALLAVTVLVLFLGLGLAIKRYVSAPVADIVGFLHRYRLGQDEGAISEDAGRGLTETTEIIRAVNDMTGVIHQYTEELEAREQLFRTVTEFSYHWAFWIGPDGKLRYVSPSCERVTGYTQQQFLDSQDLFVDIVHPEDRALWTRHLKHLDTQDDQHWIDFRIQTRSGEDRWVRHFCCPIVNEQGDYLGRRGTNIDVTEQKRAEDRLTYGAYYDELTGLGNRRFFIEHMQQAMARQQRGAPAFAVLFLDLDRFKMINDSLGHLIGDKLLQGIAHRLQHELRPQDTVARFGGDEFGVLMEGASAADKAVRFAERIAGRLRESFQLDEYEVFTSVSIGIAVGTPDTTDPEDMLRDADTAMYRAKAMGTGKYSVFDQDMHERVAARLTMETELRKAVQNQEFVIVYQPIVDLKTGVCVGVEALLRWQSPNLGPVSPAIFIPVAEDSGAMIAIGDWVLRQVCSQVAAWVQDEALIEGFRVHVNLSGTQFAQPDLAGAVEASLQDNGLVPGLLQLEVTEGALMDHANATVRGIAERFRAIGVGLCLDDFGTGYSSLSYLRNLPFTGLKIDRGFVDALSSSPRDRAIVQATLNLGRDLGMEVVAEGVEREAEARLLRAMGCHMVQGFLFARPLSAQETLAFMLAHASGTPATQT